MNPCHCNRESNGSKTGAGSTGTGGGSREAG